jgi:UDP-N-acetylglucosamine 1-carboxyvinyltransferase
MLTQARGESVIHERVYDNRLLYVHELTKMGAEIDVRGQTAVVYGPRRLKGAQVRALDIRSGAALVLGGLVAQGTTTVADIHHLDRGYTDADGKLRGLGALIERVGAPSGAGAALG